MLLSTLVWTILIIVLFVLILIMGSIISYWRTGDVIAILFFVSILIIGGILNGQSDYSRETYHDNNFKQTIVAADEEIERAEKLKMKVNTEGLNIRVKDLTSKLIHMDGVNKELKDSYGEYNRVCNFKCGNKNFQQ